MIDKSYSQEGENIFNHRAFSPESRDQEYAEFFRFLRQTGYLDFLCSMNPLQLRCSSWFKLRVYAEPLSRPVIDLFLLNKSVSRKVIKSISSVVWRRLLDEGIAVENGSSVAIPSHSLIYQHGLLLFIDSPIISADANVYYGDDSIALLNRLQPSPDSLMLDIYSGSGVQAIASAKRAKHSYAIEVNPIAARMIELNAELNFTRKNMTIICSSLYSDIAV